MLQKSQDYTKYELSKCSRSLKIITSVEEAKYIMERGTRAFFFPSDVLMLKKCALIVAFNVTWEENCGAKGDKEPKLFFYLDSPIHCLPSVTFASSVPCFMHKSASSVWLPGSNFMPVCILLSAIFINCNLHKRHQSLSFYVITYEDWRIRIPLDRRDGTGIASVGQQWTQKNKPNCMPWYELRWRAELKLHVFLRTMIS